MIRGMKEKIFAHMSKTFATSFPLVKSLGIGRGTKKACSGGPETVSAVVLCGMLLPSFGKAIRVDMWAGKMLIP